MIYKVLILFAAFAAANAQLYGGNGFLFNTGVSSWPQMQEGGDVYRNNRGSYALRDIDGRARNVEYIADGPGFRTGAPGTAFREPASVGIENTFTMPSDITRNSPTIDYGIASSLVSAVPESQGQVLGYNPGIRNGAYFGSDIKKRLEIGYRYEDNYI